MPNIHVLEENAPMLSYETKRKAADATLWMITLLWGGYPLVKGTWAVLSGSFTGMIVLEALLLTVGCAMASSKVTQIRDQLDTLEKKQLDPHKYDEDVLYWEEGDTLKLKEEEDGDVMETEFVGFTDDSTAVVKENTYRGEDPLHEFALPELESYKNEEAQERKKEAEREKLLAKVDNSWYNEKIDQLRDLENQKQQLMQEIEEDPELAEFEEKLDEENKLPESEAIGSSSEVSGEGAEAPELTRIKT